MVYIAERRLPKKPNPTNTGISQIQTHHMDFCRTALLTTVPSECQNGADKGNNKQNSDLEKKTK